MKWAIPLIFLSSLGWGATSTSLPSTCVNETSTGTIAWVNPDKAVVQDGVYATGTETVGQKSNFLSCSGYVFSVPANATITGISHSELQETIGGADCADSTFILTINASSSTDHGTESPWFAGTQTYGGASDLWGLSVTPANVSSIVSKHSITKQLGGPLSCIGGIDTTSETVTYTLPSATQGFDYEDTF